MLPRPESVRVSRTRRRGRPSAEHIDFPVTIARDFGDSLDDRSVGAVDDDHVAHGDRTDHARGQSQGSVVVGRRHAPADESYDSERLQVRSRHARCEHRHTDVQISPMVHRIKGYSDRPAISCRMGPFAVPRER